MTGVHCKSPSHLRVTTGSGSGHVTRLGEIQPVYLADLGCAHPVGYTGDGVLLQIATKPGEGLHLLPDAVTWLPNELRLGAQSAGSNGFVDLWHTILGVFEIWRAFTSGAAMQVADGIDAVWAAK